MVQYVEVGTVAAADRVAGGMLLHLDLPQLAAAVRPGQFLLVQCADPEFPALDPFLPRPFFAFAADAAGGRVSVLVRRVGKGSAWLAGRGAGDRVRLHGPAGREVRPERLTRHLLLLADGAYALPAVAFLAADAARRGVSVTMVENRPDDAAPAGGVAPREMAGSAAGLLPPAVEYQTTSPAAGGLLGALPGLVAWADEVMVAAAPLLLDTLAALRRTRLAPFTLHGNLPVQAIPVAPHQPGAGEPPSVLVPCGTGACGACVIATAAGWRLFCREGPAFPLESLRLETAEPEEDEADLEA